MMAGISAYYSIPYSLLIISMKDRTNSVDFNSSTRQHLHLLAVTVSIFRDNKSALNKKMQDKKNLKE